MERLTPTGAVFETDHRGRTAMPHHRHATPFATIVLGGSYVEVRDAVPERCSAGALVVHDACEEHADCFGSDTRCLNVELPAAGNGLAARGSVPLERPELRARVDAVVAAFYDGERDLPAAVRRLQAMLTDDWPQPSDTRPAWLREAMERFEWEEAVPLRSAARMAGVHETHFSRSFRRHVGLTANEYRSRMRIERASKLLLATTYSLTRVALSCGFSDQSHLTRAFSARLGLTPAGFRRTFAR
jgi:AraC family transcriptional regulator